jgi:hypothetical protein
MKPINGTPTICEVRLHDPKASLGYRVLYRGTRRQSEFFIDTILDDQQPDVFLFDPTESV